MNKKQKAILCDIDGTLATRAYRGPFDWAKVGEDKIKTPVANLLENYNSLGYTIILLSGRDSVCRPETRRWLKRNNVAYKSLFMRVEGDNRKDTIVKGEIYNDCIEGQFDIEFVLDDRNQVVEMWRELGLTCFQVAEGDF